MLTKEEILAEVQKLQYFYGLKHEIRYAQERTENTESVAEHIYGMHVLADYFIELEDPLHTWDKARILQMITWHDMDELETGDVPGYLKTDAHRAREVLAIKTVLEHVPSVIAETIKSITDEYTAQETQEARFVKALDKIEPLFQLYGNENGKSLMHKNKTTLEQSRMIKDKYVEEFLYMREFNNVINMQLAEEGFFVQHA